MSGYATSSYGCNPQCGGNNYCMSGYNNQSYCSPMYDASGARIAFDMCSALSCPTGWTVASMDSSASCSIFVNGTTNGNNHVKCVPTP